MTCRLARTCWIDDAAGPEHELIARNTTQSGKKVDEDGAVFAIATLCRHGFLRGLPVVTRGMVRVDVIREVREESFHALQDKHDKFVVCWHARNTRGKSEEFRRGVLDLIVQPITQVRSFPVSRVKHVPHEPLHPRLFKERPELWVRSNDGCIVSYGLHTLNTPVLPTLF